MTTPWHLREAARRVHQGGVIAYPTEAVYGLGCDPLNRDAVMRILTIKQRPIEKGMILIASDFDQLRPFVEPPTDAIWTRIGDSWPGPATWIIPAPPSTPTWLRGTHDSLAVRVTAHPLAAALCAAFGGPIVSTSANAAGRPPARSALQARLRCPGVDLVMGGATGKARQPTRIRDALTGKTLRAG